MSIQQDEAGIIDEREKDSCFLVVGCVLLLWLF